MSSGFFKITPRYKSTNVFYVKSLAKDVIGEGPNHRARSDEDLVRCLNDAVYNGIVFL